jgi:hypothetical protein
MVTISVVRCSFASIERIGCSIFSHAFSDAFLVSSSASPHGEDYASGSARSTDADTGDAVRVILRAQILQAGHDCIAPFNIRRVFYPKGSFIVKTTFRLYTLPPRIGPAGGMNTLL